VSGTEKFLAARLWAVNRMPYLASALFACTVHPAPGSATIGVDRSWRVHGDPDVVEQLLVPELGRLLLHLVSHLLREHPARADALHFPDQRQPWWQRCADAEINDDLDAAGELPPVANTVPSALGLADGQLAESYFAAQPPDQPDQSAGPDRPWDCGSGADGRSRPWEADGDGGLTPAQAELLRYGTASGIQRQHAQQPGTVPGGWLRWAESVLPARTDWRRILAAELRGAVAAVAGNVDYTYRRISRRTDALASEPRVVLPSLRRPMPTVAVVCDTSGSMSDDLLVRALAEVEALLARTGLRSTGITVLAVDTDVHATTRVHRAAHVQLAGGGGTDMAAGILAAAALRPRPDIIVVLTDGWTPWPEAPPRGIRVVVGLLRSSEMDDGIETPAWARTVLIDPELSAGWGDR
jgi:predicted metal-dependent peptidase